MAFGVFSNELQKAYFFVAIIFTPFTILAVVLRFIATKRAGLRLQAEDWLALASLILYLAFDGVTLADEIIGNGRDTFGLLAHPADLVSVRKLTFSALWIYFWQQLVVKFSIMALYHRLFWVNKKVSRCIYALFVYHIVYILVVSFLLGFHCQPLEKFWHPLLPGRCISDGTFIAFAESVNSLSDFLLVILAVAMVRILQVSGKAKRKLAFLFGLGSLAGILGFIKIGMSFNPDSIYVFTMVAIWSNVQAAVGIVCCCAPVYKPILPSSAFWVRLTSKVSFASLRETRWRSGRSKSSFERTDSQNNQPHWTQRQDGSSKGLVWSERQGEVTPHENEYVLSSIQVRKDVEVK